MFSTVEDEVSSFANGLITSKINTETNGTSVSINVEDGTKPQNFNIDIKQLAKNDIYQKVLLLLIQ